MIRVLFFVYSLDGGGAEKALIDLVENLDKKQIRHHHTRL